MERKLNMKGKTICKTAALALGLLLSFLLPAMAIPQDGPKLGITLRIEGIGENLYYAKAQIPYEDTLTVQQALSYIDVQTQDLDIAGLDTGFISCINGEASGTFGGWDGWLYTVNGNEAAVGIGECLLSEGDSILLYYGDPYGVGMQFPQADLSRLGEGILKFTSRDTTFDESFNPVVTVNPVTGAAVSFYYGDTLASYNTDENGEIVIDPAQLTPGAHRVQIEKYAEDAVSGKYLPLVLRLAPDYTVNVEEIPKTGPDKTWQPALCLIMASAALAFAVAGKRRLRAR